MHGTRKAEVTRAAQCMHEAATNSASGLPQPIDKNNSLEMYRVTGTSGEELCYTTLHVDNARRILIAIHMIVGYVSGWQMI